MNREIEEYLAYAVALGRAEQSVHSYRFRLCRFHSYVADRGSGRLQDVTIELVRDYHDEMRRRQLKASSRRTLLSTVKEFLRWAHESGRMPADLAPRVELPRPEQTLPPKPLTDDDVSRLLRLFSSKKPVSRRNRAILQLLYACGLRKSELLALSVGDVNFAEATVFVRSGKGNKDRLLPVHRTALRAIAAYLSTRPGQLFRGTPLFATQAGNGSFGKRLTLQAIQRVFVKINRRFHKHVYPHLLRHTFAVHLLQGGADLRLYGPRFPGQ